MTLSINEYRNKVKELNDSFLLDLKKGLKQCINRVHLPVRKLGEHLFSVKFSSLSSLNWSPYQFDKDLLIKQIEDCDTVSKLLSMLKDVDFKKNLHPLICKEICEFMKGVEK
jgi:hypothetical protein